MSDSLLSSVDVAKLLRVTDKQARALMRRMEHVDLGAGVVRVSHAALSSFIEATTCKASSTEDPDHCCTGSATKTSADSLLSTAQEPSTLQKQRSSLLSLAAPAELRPVQPRTRPKTQKAPSRKR